MLSSDDGIFPENSDGIHIEITKGIDFHNQLGGHILGCFKFLFDVIKYRMWWQCLNCNGVHH